MHILLTDILTCPRCGPQFGLILLAERMSERRVEAGALGCANCREKYVVADGVVHFAETAPPQVGAGDTATAERLAALAAAGTGRGYVLLCGPAARHAAEVAALLEDVEVIAAAVRVDASGGAAPAAESQGDASQATSSGGRVSLLTLGRRLPFGNARLNGIVLSSAAADTLLEEGARVLSPLGRLVLEDAPADAAARLEAAGLRVLAAESGTFVAART